MKSFVVLQKGAKLNKHFVGSWLTVAYIVAGPNRERGIKPVGSLSHFSSITDSLVQVVGGNIFYSFSIYFKNINKKNIVKTG